MDISENIWTQHHNIFRPWQRMDLRRTWETYLLGQDELLSIQIKICGAKERECSGQILVHACRHHHPNTIGTAGHELGELVDSSLKDTAAIHNSIKDLDAWLTKVDKSGWPGCFKA